MTTAAPGIVDTWAAYQNLFSNALEGANRAPRTIAIYGFSIGQLGKFLRSVGMPEDPTVVTREHLTEWLRWMHRPTSEGGAGLGPATVSQRYRAVQQFFKWLEMTEERRDNPMTKLTAPTVPEKPVPVVGGDDLRKLLKACQGKDFEARRDRAIIGLFIDTGMRVGEMAGITVADLDVDAKRVMVTGKGRRSRELAFVADTGAELRWYLLTRGKRKDRGEPWLWLGARGRLTDWGIRQMISRRCEQAGIAHIHPHQLRHSFAHEYLKAGGNEGDLMRITGWKSRSMVDRYGASAATERALSAHEKFSPRKSL